MPIRPAVLRVIALLSLVAALAGCSATSGSDCSTITNCTASCVSGYCEYSGDDCAAADDGSKCRSADPVGTATAALTTPWVWVDDSRIKCADGSSSGYAYRDSPTGDTRLMVYFRFGGACWKWTGAGGLNNCNSSVGASADNLTGYTSSTFGTDVTAFATSGILSQDPAMNPAFSTYRAVFVPYCTGDLHGGSNVTTYTDSLHVNHVLSHVGYTNAGFILGEAAARYGDAEQVVIAGSSAGSMGAATNAHRVTALWPSAERVLYADSQFWLRPVYITSAIIQAADVRWKTIANWSAWCPECVPSTVNTAVGPWRMYAKMGGNGDLARQAYLSHIKDSNISVRWSDTGGNANLKCSKTLAEPPFCEYGQTPHSGYAYPALGDFQHFAAPASGHVFLFAPGQVGPPSNYSHILAVAFPGAENGDLSAIVQSGVSEADWSTAFRDNVGFVDVL